MRLTKEQYKEMSERLGKDVNEDTNFEELSYELQQDRHELIHTLTHYLSFTDTMLIVNKELIKNNKSLLNDPDMPDPTQKRILN